MKDEFSLLDFEDDFSDHRKKFFIFMARTMPHIRKEVHYLPRKKINKTTDTRCVIKIYDTKQVLEILNKRIETCSKGNAKRLPQWKDHIETIRRVTNG